MQSLTQQQLLSVQNIGICLSFYAQFCRNDAQEEMKQMISSSQCNGKPHELNAEHKSVPRIKLVSPSYCKLDWCLEKSCRATNLGSQCRPNTGPVSVQTSTLNFPLSCSGSVEMEQPGEWNCFDHLSALTKPILSPVLVPSPC